MALKGNERQGFCNTELSFFLRGEKRLSQHVLKLFCGKASIDAACTYVVLPLCLANQVFQLVFLSFHPDFINLFLDCSLNQIAVDIGSACLANPMDTVDGLAYKNASAVSARVSAVSQRAHPNLLTLVV